MKTNNIRKQMELEHQKEETPITYVSFLWRTNGNKELAQEIADKYNKKHTPQEN